MGADELIDAYLYELRGALRGSERERIVAEIEDHLWESWERYIAEGLEPEDAARLAIARFGGARDIASGFAPDAPGRRFARAYFAIATLAGSVLLTVGLTAILALPVHAVLGPDFLFGPEGQWQAPAQFCSEHASGGDCQQMWDDFFVARAFGIGAVATLFGGLIVAAHVLARRYAFGGLSRIMLVGGMYAFGLAALLFLGGGTLKYTFADAGWNTWLPAGIASMIVSGSYALILRASERNVDSIAA